MIDAILSGRIYGAPAEKTSGKTGKRFVTAKVRAAAGDGEALFANIIAFNPEVCAGLMALNEGDAVAVCGELTPKVWVDKNGQARPALDLVAHGLLTAYHVTRKRKAMQPDQDDAKAPRRQQVEPDFDDGETPF